MLKPLDLYAFEETKALDPFGVATFKYEFRKYHDVRKLGSVPAYLLLCTQRVVVAGSTAYNAGPMNTTGYSNYPAIIINQITPQVNNGATTVVKTMFPRTLNATVSTSVNTGGSTTNATEYQHTSGSSTTTTNTFSLFTPDFGHGKDKDTSRSTTHGSTSSTESSISSGDEMSIKDWGSYGYQTGNTITWVWGQAYPWDVLQYNQNSGSNSPLYGDPIITLPTFVQQRLVDNNTLVLPPSALSLFGCDFTMKVGWLIEFPGGISGDETVTMQHHMICYHASHGFDSKNSNAFEATLQTADDASSGSYTPDSTLSMSTYALDPIKTPSANNGAIIGFTADPFTYGPPTSSEFKIISSANNLQVAGNGFDASLTTTFASTPTLTVQFKIIDRVSAYSLLLKHWIGPSSNPCMMTFTMNNGQQVTIYVTAPEGMGAQNNLSVIDLRNLNFASINFHDYLVIGLNTITVTISPVDQGKENNQYTLFALAVGRA